MTQILEVEAATEEIQSDAPTCPARTEWRFYTITKDGWHLDDFTSMEKLAIEYRKKYEGRRIHVMIVTTKLPAVGGENGD